MNWFKKKEEEPKQRDEILTLPNGCRLNLTLYGRIISEKILRGDYNISNAHHLASLTNEDYKNGIERVRKEILGK
jgi:hypothetical protein